MLQTGPDAIVSSSAISATFDESVESHELLEGLKSPFILASVKLFSVSGVDTWASNHSSVILRGVLCIRTLDGQV